MSRILAERCPRCGEILTFTEQATQLSCPCGHSFLVAEFIVRQLEMEQAKSGKAEAEKQRAAAEAEKSALQARLNNTLSALQHIEAASQAGDKKLQALLDGMKADRQSHTALTELLRAVKSGQAAGQDTLTRLMQAFMQNQSGAEAKLTAVQQLAERILSVQQAEGRAARELRQQIQAEIDELHMDAAARDELADDFYDWSRRMQAEDVSRLQSLQSASGTLLKGQKALSDQISGVEKKISAAEAAINAGFDKLQQQRLHEMTELYHQATSLQAERRFDEAEAKYRKLLEKGKEAQCAEVYWRMLLCHYGVEYQKDNGKLIPIILRPDLSEFGAKSVRKELNDHLATPEQKKHYTARLEKIDFYLNRYRKVKQDKNWQYDVFISVKQNDKGRHTLDSIAAFSLYKRFVEDTKLAQKKLRVFNSACVKLPAGEEYEPYIIQALLSSKVLIVVGSKPEYMESQWVKNEWSRFQYLMETDKDTERMLFCYLTGGMVPNSIPAALNPNKEAIVDGPNAGDLLREAIERAFPSAKGSTPKGSAPVGDEAEIVSSMQTWVKVGQFKLVTDKYDALVEKRPDLLKEPWFCLSALCAQHQCRTLEQLAKKLPDLRSEGLYELACENADKELRKKLYELTKKIEKITYNNGVYEGEVKDGKEHGHGVLTFADGDKYDGEWKDGKRNGHGVYTWANGNKYDGEWKEGKQHGHGVKTYSDGDKYDGEWKDGKYHGHGVYTWADGRKYDGEWKDDQMHGHGVFTNPDGRRYDGEWWNDNRHGHGTMYYANGTKWEGKWEDDKPLKSLFRKLFG